MTASDFQPDRLNLEEIFTRRFYRIPRFQRPYSWEPTQLEDFWEDVFVDNPVGYFIGPMVGWRTGKNAPHANVVDGQQRLTTVTIALCVIRDSLAELGEASLAEGVQLYIERRDRNNETHFVLQPEDHGPYFNNGILKYPRDVSAGPSNLSEKNLAATHAWLRKQVSSVASKSTDGPSKADAVKELLRLRDQLLGLHVIWIEHTSEDDAYVLFETLNSRGKDLDVADLLKNLILQKIKTKNAKADAVRDSWDMMRTGLESVDPPIDIDRFIQHWWLSNEEFVAVRKLFSRIKLKVKSAADAQYRLDSLVTDSRLYQNISFPRLRDWSPEEFEIRDALEALLVFGVAQPAPLLLSLLRARATSEVKMKHLRPTFQAIESYHCQSTAIAATSSGRGISAMYARYARELTNASSTEVATELLQQLRSNLSDRLPDPLVFDQGFKELEYSDVFTRDKRLVQYVARRLHESQKQHRPNKPTLEHLAPQKSASADLSVTVIGGIGNLLWIDEDLNVELGSKSFKEKQKILSHHRELYDMEDILAATKWGEEEILQRGERLAQIAREQVWNI